MLTYGFMNRLFISFLIVGCTSAMSMENNTYCGKYTDINYKNLRLAEERIIEVEQPYFPNSPRVRSYYKSLAHPINAEEALFVACSVVIFDITPTNKVQNPKVVFSHPSLLTEFKSSSLKAIKKSNYKYIEKSNNKGVQIYTYSIK